MGLTREFASNGERLASSGIPAPAQFERIVFSPVEKGDPAVSADIAGFLCRAIYEADIELEQSVFDAVEQPLLTRKKTVEDTQTAQQEVLSAVYDELQVNQDTHLIGLLHGIMPAYKTLWDANDDAAYRNRLEAKRVSGYSADTAKTVSVEGTLKAEHATASFVIILDDILDSGHELANVKYLLEILRGKTPHPERVNMLQEAASKDFSLSSQLYDEVVREFKEAGIVIAAIAYKNIPFKQSLERLIEQSPADDIWATMQKNILKSAIELKQTDWIMGTGMDSDVLGEQMIDRIKQLISVEDLTDEVMTMIEIIAKQKFRIGGFIEGLVAMNRSDKRDLIEGVAKSMAKSLLEWQRVKYRWELMYQIEPTDMKPWANTLLKELQ